jgi:anaerobic selenocysteine-containing dehydrogenase
MRLGFAEHFWQGDIDAAYRHQLAASGLTLEELRAAPGGLRVALTPRHRKYAERDQQGRARGFSTPSRKVELWSETFLDHGYQALPEFVAPEAGSPARAGLAQRYPLVLTCAKPIVFCQTQHRALPALRKHALDPEVELHPATAAARKIAAGSWVALETPAGAMRARARLNDKLDPRVVVGEHGWWQGCEALGAASYDPFDPGGANFNGTVDATARDPVSGTPAHRANRCEVRLAAAPAMAGKAR